MHLSNNNKSLRNIVLFIIIYISNTHCFAQLTFGSFPDRLANDDERFERYASFVSEYLEKLNEKPGVMLPRNAVNEYLNKMKEDGLTIEIGKEKIYGLNPERKVFYGFDPGDKGPQVSKKPLHQYSVSWVFLPKNLIAVCFIKSEGNFYKTLTIPVTKIHELMKKKIPSKSLGIDAEIDFDTDTEIYKFAEDVTWALFLAEVKNESDTREKWNIEGNEDVKFDSKSVEIFINMMHENVILTEEVKNFLYETVENGSVMGGLMLYLFKDKFNEDISQEYLELGCSNVNYFLSNLNGGDKQSLEIWKNYINKRHFAELVWSYVYSYIDSAPRYNLPKDHGSLMAIHNIKRALSPQGYPINIVYKNAASKGSLLGTYFYFEEVISYMYKKGSGLNDNFVMSFFDIIKEKKEEQFSPYLDRRMKIMFINKLFQGPLYNNEEYVDRYEIGVSLLEELKENNNINAALSLAWLKITGRYKGTFLGTTTYKKLPEKYINIDEGENILISILSDDKNINEEYIKLIQKQILPESSNEKFKKIINSYK